MSKSLTELIRDANREITPADRHAILDLIEQQAAALEAANARIAELEAAAKAEPVGWAWKPRGGRLDFSDAQDRPSEADLQFAKDNGGEFVPLYTAPAALAQPLEAQADARWQPIETAPEGKLLVVCWLDKEDAEHPERHEFDYLEDGVWAKHADDYDHFCCVAPPGSRGPSADAPYTHWMPLPKLPAALSQKAGERQ